MHSSMRIVCVTAAAVIVCSPARGATKTMPIDLVGEWCKEDGAPENEAWFNLPSWTPDGKCTGILAIDQYGFYFRDQQKRCEPQKITTGKSTAPTGGDYSTTITARCRPDGPPTKGQLQTFDFYRYKGRLTVTTK